MAPLNRGIRKKVFIHAYHVRQLVHPTMSNFAQQAQNQASQLGQSAQNQASQLGQSAQHQAGNAGEGTSSLSPTVCLTIRSSALRRPGQAVARLPEVNALLYSVRTITNIYFARRHARVERAHRRKPQAQLREAHRRAIFDDEMAYAAYAAGP